MEEEVWEVIRRGETPEELVLDPETGLEGFLSGCGCLQLIFGIFFLMALAEEPELAWVGAVLLLMGILFFVVRGKLDDHYVLDFSGRRLLFNRTFFGKVSRRPICSFDELGALVVEPERNSSKHSVWWEYGLTLVRRGGQTVKVVTPEEQDYDKVVRHGRQVAELLKLEFHEGQPQTILKVSPGPVIEYAPFSYGGMIWILIAVVIGLVMLTAFLVASVN